jgi:hypothetical protein
MGESATGREPGWFTAPFQESFGYGAALLRVTGGEGGEIEQAPPALSSEAATIHSTEEPPPLGDRGRLTLAKRESPQKLEWTERSTLAWGISRGKAVNPFFKDSGT